MNKQAKNLTTQICINGVMAALFIVLDLISVRIGNHIKITFSGLPIIISAIYFGPIAGTVVGGMGGLIGQAITYAKLSITTPLWILPAIARGFIVGILYKCFGKKYLSVYIVISSLIVSALNTLAIYVDSKIYGYYNPVTFLSGTAFRFISGIITAVVYIAVIYAIMKALDKVIKRR